MALDSGLSHESDVVVCHASVEDPRMPWGGAGVAVGLCARAGAECGQVSIALFPGADNTEQVGGQGELYWSVQIPGLGKGGVYSSDERIALGRRISDEFYKLLLHRLSRRRVLLVVHSDELERLASKAKLRPSWTVIAACHGLAYQEHPGAEALHDQQARLLENAESIIGFSHSHTQQIRAVTSPHRRVTYIPLPLSLLLADEAGYSDPHVVNQGQQRLLCGGRAVRQKGFDLFLRALNTLETTHYRAHLVMGHGQPAYMESCRSLARELGVGVAISSWMSSEAWLSEVGSSTCLVVPSRFEPLGLVAAEAIALGTTVVGTAVGGLEELIGLDASSESVPISPGDDEQTAESLGAAIDRVLGRTTPLHERADNPLAKLTPSLFTAALFGATS